VSFLGCHSFAPSYHQPQAKRATRSLETQRYVNLQNTADASPLGTAPDGDAAANKAKRLLIHWKGEIKEGYSFHFRQVEFEGALAAVAGERRKLKYENALEYNGQADMVDQERVYFDESMQYVDGIDNIEHAVDAVRRCSLVHAAYQIVSIEDSYRTCTEAAVDNGGFSDMYAGGDNQHDTWCVGVRLYGDVATGSKVMRHGERARSMKEERKALQDLDPLLKKLGGGVDLTNPVCKIYLFNGLKGKAVLARRIAEGPQASIIGPSTRLCITSTPLCPIAAFTLCNIAGVRDGLSILDPYAGSCTTLLAAAMIAPRSRKVGIEIAHNGLVNRVDVLHDFESRNLPPPLALVKGDSTSASVRDEARQYIDGDAFDIIVSDPPYGIRESGNYNEQDPISELCDSIALDREAGKPLLRKGGKLVVFVPCTEEERIEDCLPTDAKLERAGLEILDMKEQPLNDKLSRWLVSFKYIE
jgi:tRNA G10  N-methylase Trm11